MKSVNMTVDQRVPGVDLTPRRGSAGAAGYDLRLASDAPVVIMGGQPPELLPTGVRIDMSEETQMCALIMPRSGLGHKQGVFLGNTVGLIDSDYTGELFVSFGLRPSCGFSVQSMLTLNPGDRIAQVVFMPIYTPNFHLTEDLSATERGAAGFGSTGVA